MPQRLVKIILLLLALTACATVPPYEPLKPQNFVVVCPNIFPEKAFHAVHHIEITSPRSGKSAFIGAVRGEPDRSTLHAVLMSAEGMVLFDAEIKEGDLRVISALPPLDDPAFARGLMADVSFLLLKPAGNPIEMGANRQGLTACRWPTANEGMFEQALMRSGDIRSRLYDQAGRIIKEALAVPPFDRGLPAEMHLRVSGPAEYSIDLKLLDME